VIKQFYPFMKDIEKLLNDNRIFRQRTVDIGTATKEQALDWGFSGPMIRARVLPGTCASSQPYMSTSAWISTSRSAAAGDCFARYSCASRDVPERAHHGAVREGAAHGEGPRFASTIARSRRRGAPR